jgi:DNA-binding transcriptional LysR family regulator
MNIKKQDLYLLVCFDALAACRSVSKAAQMLNITQPAMSNALARLRKTFSDELFLRTRNGVTPTPKALDLIEPVRNALRDIEVIMTPAQDFDPRVTRAKLTLTTTGYVEFVFTPKLVRRMERVAPKIQLESRIPNRELANQRLERGEIDFRIGWDEQPSEKLRYVNLFQDKFVCIARANHPELGGGLNLERYCDLQHARTVTRSHMRSVENIDRAVATHGRRLRIAMVSHDYIAVPHIVSQSNLIATVPERLADLLMKQLPLRKYDCPVKVPGHAIRLYWHDRTHKSPLHRWFRSLVTEVAATL